MTRYDGRAKRPAWRDSLSGSFRRKTEAEMEGLDTTQPGWLISLGLLAVMAILGGSWFWLRREAEKISSLWDDIYFQLRNRCEMVRELNSHLRKVLHTNPKLVDDIHYLLERMEQTNDPHTHAAVQNSLVLSVQSAVEQFHRSEQVRSDSELYRTMKAIGALDSRLAPMRDRYNDSTRRHNKRLNTLPFSLAGMFTRCHERALFPMLIPWWSTEAAAYGAITSDDIRHQLQTWKAPIIVVPSQRAQWGGTRVIHVEKPPSEPQEGGCLEKANGGNPAGGQRA